MSHRKTNATAPVLDSTDLQMAIVAVARQRLTVPSVGGTERASRSPADAYDGTAEGARHTKHSLPPLFSTDPQNTAVFNPLVVQLESF